jgi:hypothetical protein
MGKNEAQAAQCSLGVLVGCRMMVFSLKLEKLVDGAHHARSIASEAERGTPREVLDRVGNFRSMSCHDLSTGNDPGVNQTGQVKIAGGKARSDLPHMVLDLEGSQAVFIIALQLDSAAVRKRLEDVGRGVLVNSHGGLPAGLDSRVGSVGPGSGTAVGHRCRLFAASDDEQDD